MRQHYSDTPTRTGSGGNDDCNTISNQSISINETTKSTTTPHNSVTCGNDEDSDLLDIELFYEETHDTWNESLAKKVMAFLMGTFGKAPKNNDLPHRYELP